MPKGTILDRLAGAMETLGKREGKSLTPRQRVAAAQRWNSLADIGDSRLDALDRLSSRTDRTGEIAASNYADAMYTLEDLGLLESSGFRADNPFLSDNIDKYAEQSDFLYWCRYNRVEPNSQNLKRYRWETYQTLPYRQRQWIANKDAIKSYLGPEMYGYPKAELDMLKALGDLVDDLLYAHPESDRPRHYPMQVSPVFESMDEFPDDFNYMWRY